MRLLLLLLLVCLAAPVRAYSSLHTDDRQLERDYRWTEPLRTVAPQLLETTPWETVEPGVRHKVLGQPAMDQRFRQHWEVGPGPTILRYQVTRL